jgi:outer membrane protein assembly factor BamB
VEIVVPGLHDDAEIGESAEADPPARRSARRVAVFATAIALVTGVAAGAVWTRDDGPARPVFEEIAGADSRRLPATSAVIWTSKIDAPNEGASDPAFIVDGRSTVVVILDDTTDGATLIGLDATSGAERWRTRADFEPSAATLLGVIDGVLVIERNDLVARSLVGVETATGDMVWELDTRDNGVHVILSGTDVITRVSFTGDERLTFIDPASGGEVARINGRILGTDLSGTWFVSSGRRLLSIDLADGYTEPTEIASSATNWDSPTTVVEGRVIVVDTDGTLAEVLPDSTDLVSLVTVGGNLPDIASLISTGGPTLMGIGDGKVLGATLTGDQVVINWQLDASVRVVDVTRRGLLVAVSDATNGLIDGVDLAVIDAVSGERLAAIGSAPSQDELPRLLGDGFVVTDDAQLGFERIGYDLDGAEVWRLPSNDPVRIGDRIVVTVGTSATGYTVAAFGDAT